MATILLVDDERSIRNTLSRILTNENDEVDRLCEAGIATVEPAKREEIYTRLQHLWFEEAIGIPLYQQINIRAYRDWIDGYVPNAMLTDSWEDLKRIVKKIPPG